MITKHHRLIIINESTTKYSRENICVTKILCHSKCRPLGLIKYDGSVIEYPYYRDRLHPIEPTKYTIYVNVGSEDFNTGEEKTKKKLSVKAEL